MIFSYFVATDFFKKESRSPRGFLPRSRIFSCWKIPRPFLARLRSLRPCEATLLTLLRAGESVALPPSPYRSSTPFGYFVLPYSQNLSKGLAKVSHTFSPQNNSGGAHHFRFRFLDLCMRFGKIISKVCEGFNSGVLKNVKNS